ncbi:MAG TPA: ABC transporter permease [Candidatus Woesearchaeota archaeon]|nr:ABC transporter permease [Candidatus Woesearchaeota archaeon]
MEVLLLAAKHLRRLSFRSWVTIIGIVISVAAIVALTSLGDGLRTAVTGQFEQLGANRIIVSPGRSFELGGPLGASFSTTSLGERDLDEIRRVTGVELATGVMTKPGTIEFAGKEINTFVAGAEIDSDTIRLAMQTDDIKAEKGRFLREGDQRSVYIGSRIAYDMFEREIRLGDKLVIESRRFNVVGIQAESSIPFNNRMIRIPIDEFKDIFGIRDSEYNMIIVSVADGYDIDLVSDRITRALRRFRRVKEGQEDFEVQTTQQIISSYETLLTVVQMVVVGIVSISLVVGGIGISNTMFTSVLERTREIGVMKSIGARNGHIMSIFLMESGFLGLVGGIIGLAVGALLAFSVEFTAGLAGFGMIKVSISAGLILFALAFSFGVGVLSGVIPALRAARLNPAETLRYE